MKRIAIIVTVVCGLLGGASQAQAASPYTFEAVDAVAVEGTTLKVTGILAGGTLTTEVSANFWESGATTDYLANCQRMALLAMSRPGLYAFKLYAFASGIPAWRCALSRVTP